MPLEKLSSSCAYCVKSDCDQACQFAHWPAHKKSCKQEAAAQHAVEEGSMSKPLTSALFTQLELFQLEVKDDIIYFLAIPYIPLLFDGVGLPLFIHFHFIFSPGRRGGIRSQFKVDFARQTSRKEYIEWTKKFTGPESAVDEAKTWDYELSEDARKPKPTTKLGRKPARIRLIFTASADQKDGNGYAGVRWVTQRIGNSTASALDKRNAKIDWKAPVKRFLNTAKTPSSIEERVLIILEHYGLANDKAWVARACEAFAKADPMMQSVARSLQQYTGAKYSVEIIHFCMEFDWNR
ncbi:hypothetical protein P7C70_g3736, partial [Phenoliferia sp. Uapishka_3]